MNTWEMLGHNILSYKINDDMICYDIFLTAIMLTSHVSSTIHTHNNTQNNKMKQNTQN